MTPKPQTSETMPKEIWVIGKSADEHREFEDLNCLWSHKDSWTECTKYIRSDLVSQSALETSVSVSKEVIEAVIYEFRDAPVKDWAAKSIALTNLEAALKRGQNEN